MPPAERFLAFLVLLCVWAIVLRGVAHRLQMPYTVVLAVGGVLAGLVPGGASGQAQPDLILFAFVPGLVFQAALTLRLDALRRVLVPVSILATAGVGATVGLLGVAVHYLTGIAWSGSFLMAAILAPTDPVSVVSVLREIHAPQRLVTLLEGESLLNDGTGVAVFTALLASLTAGSLSAGDVLARFGIATFGGIAVGAAIGIAGIFVLRATTEANMEFLISLAMAYGSYLGADVIHVSGIVAVVTAACVIVIAGQRLHLHGAELLEFWGLVSFILNALLFLLIGTAIPAYDLTGYVVPMIAVFLATVAVRVVVVHITLAVSDPRVRRLPWRWRHLAVTAGLRGALSVALALSLIGQTGVDPRVRVIAYGVVLLTLVIQGIIVPVYARRAGLSAPPPAA